MSAIDQLALDLLGVAVTRPKVLERLSERDRIAALDVLTRLIVKTIAPERIVADATTRRYSPATSWHASPQTANVLPPFPCARLSRVRSTTAAPPRPGPVG